jgi:hypothetical protein
MDDAKADKDLAVARAMPSSPGTKAVNATRFLSYADMAEAIETAIRSYRATGKSGRIRIGYSHDIGEGFYAHTGVYGRTRVVVVVLDGQGIPVTAYPRLPNAQ